MSAFQPRLDKLGGLPNIFFIKRKLKPLGTEFKTICDTETGVGKFIEVQEENEAMRVKERSISHGVTSGCTIRLANACSTITTILADSWLGSVKVLPPPPSPHPYTMLNDDDACFDAHAFDHLLLLLMLLPLLLMLLSLLLLLLLLLPLLLLQLPLLLLLLIMSACGRHLRDEWRRGNITGSSPPYETHMGS